MTGDRLLPKTVEELEQMARIERTVPTALTRRDVERITLKRLGPGWGKKRKSR